jgi:hypothetical protein
VKKYLILFHDEWAKEPATMDAWQSWFAKVGDRLVDSGNPLGDGLEVTTSGARALDHDPGAATGYSILSATSLDEARALLDGCPFNSTVRVYEAVAM